MEDKILDIIKRLDVRQNVTIRVLDEATGEVIQEHVGHNAATNSLLTGIAHYLMGDGVLNQGSDTLSMWVPQYMSVGTMGLTSQESETITETIGGEEVTFVVPAALGYTPPAPSSASEEEQELNARLRYSEYVNQTPGFGADGYDDMSNNDREWFGLGLPYTLKPGNLYQDFYTWDGSATTFTLAKTPSAIVSVTLYPDGVVNEDLTDESVDRRVLQATSYSVDQNTITLTAYPSQIPADSRLAVIYTYASKDAANCELIKAKVDKYNNIVPVTLRAPITYRDMVPEVESELPNTLDVVYSAFISVGALKEYRGDNDYIYITEAGLWSKSSYNDSGDNGLLAGYRIMPSGFEIGELGVEDVFTGDGTTASFTFTNTAISISSVTIGGIELDPTKYSLDQRTNQIVFTDIPAASAVIIVLYKTTNSWMDVTKPENREAIQKSIIRLGINQVAQIIWKLQLGGLEQLGGLRSLYPAKESAEVWTIV